MGEIQDRMGYRKPALNSILGNQNAGSTYMYDVVLRSTGSICTYNTMSFKKFRPATAYIDRMHD